LRLPPSLPFRQSVLQDTDPENPSIGSKSKYAPERERERERKRESVRERERERVRDSERERERERERKGGRGSLEDPERDRVTPV